MESPLLQLIVQKATKLNRHIVLPDATDERAIQAARIVTDRSIARISLIGKEEDVRNKARSVSVDLKDIRLVDPSQSEMREDFSARFYELRKSKGLTQDESRTLM